MMKLCLICLILAVMLFAMPAVTADEPVSKLTVDSIPSGADLRVSDQFVGYTPTTVEVPGGSTVSVMIQRHGGSYDIWRGSIYVPKGEHVTYTAKLYRTEDKIRTTGYLMVTSDREGAEVYLDNGYVGSIANGMFAKDEIRLGLHQVVVQKAGYMTYTDLVEVLPKNVATTNVVADLTPLSTAVPPVPVTETVPPAPTKSPVSLFGLVAAGLVAGVGTMRQWI